MFIYWNLLRLNMTNYPKGAPGETIYETTAGYYNFTIEMFETHFEVRRHIEYEGYEHYVFPTIAAAMTGFTEIVNYFTEYYNHEFTTFEVVIITGRACRLHPLA